ncbi:hypothetical protein [Rhodanobacter sp. DHG33]|uniref:hypothetical protein n=1 Tax=Rhodanobacter sp. DHG33 TaxID=2775921 RepID=UPI00178232E6|nr:hypothetical protein [Rhodanobacter sp. DHG33]MBD8897744.1 hypothetical protein [Rhodanobacter sp. DHG33]
MLANAGLLAAAFVTAAVLDAPHVTSQILLPLLVAFSVFSTRRNACFKRGAQP